MKIKINGEDIFRITSKFGQQESFRSSPHKGIDLAMPEGTDLYSPVKGVISEVFDYGSQNAGLGLKIKLKNSQELIFGHMSQIHVKAGDVVDVGTKIGLSGNTGESLGAHLHIGLKTPSGEFIDPSVYERMLQKVYAMVQKGELISSSLVSNQPSLYNALTETLQVLIN